MKVVEFNLQFFVLYFCWNCSENVDYVKIIYNTGLYIWFIPRLFINNELCYVNRLCPSDSIYFGLAEWGCILILSQNIERARILTISFIWIYRCGFEFFFLQMCTLIHILSLYVNILNLQWLFVMTAVKYKLYILLVISDFVMQVLQPIVFKCMSKCRGAPRLSSWNPITCISNLYYWCCWKYDEFCRWFSDDNSLHFKI
jgi:hypothetical protein